LSPLANKRSPDIKFFLDFIFAKIKIVSVKNKL